jgi:hypothetical protein
MGEHLANTQGTEVRFLRGALVVAEPIGEEPGRDPDRRGFDSLRSPQP